MAATAEGLTFESQTSARLTSLTPDDIRAAAMDNALGTQGCNVAKEEMTTVETPLPSTSPMRSSLAPALRPRPRRTRHGAKPRVAATAAMS